MDLDFDPDLDGPGKSAPILIWRDGDAHQLELMWGLEPIEPGGRPVSLLRAENWQVTNPCLVIANEFALKKRGQVKYAAALITDESFFCLAGVWRPAQGGWPASFAVLTVPAYADLEPYKDRHVAVVRPEDWYPWLMQTKPKEEILRRFPAGSFEVIAPKRGRWPEGRSGQSGRSNSRSLFV